MDYIDSSTVKQFSVVNIERLIEEINENLAQQGLYFPGRIYFCPEGGLIADCKSSELKTRKIIANIALGVIGKYADGSFGVTLILSDTEKAVIPRQILKRLAQ